MTVYALLDEYDVEGYAIRVQAAIIINGHKEPPVWTFAYNSNNSRDIVSKDISSFLEKHITKGYTVFIDPKYGEKYSDILTELKPRFVTKDINELPKCMYEELQKHLDTMTEKATLSAIDCLEHIIKKTNCK